MVKVEVYGRNTVVLTKDPYQEELDFVYNNVLMGDPEDKHWSRYDKMYQVCRRVLEGGTIEEINRSFEKEVEYLHNYLKCPNLYTSPTRYSTRRHKFMTLDMKESPANLSKIKVNGTVFDISSVTYDPVKDVYEVDLLFPVVTDLRDKELALTQLRDTVLTYESIFTEIAALRHKSLWFFHKILRKQKE